MKKSSFREFYCRFCNFGTDSITELHKHEKKCYKEMTSMKPRKIAKDMRIIGRHKCGNGYYGAVIKKGRLVFCQFCGAG